MAVGRAGKLSDHRALALDDGYRKPAHRAGFFVAQWTDRQKTSIFGAGPKTAVIVAVGLWTGGYLLSLMGYHLLGLFPVSMLTIWGAVGLVEMTLASLLGAWIYREGMID